jgi:hypothetical protein
MHRIEPNQFDHFQKVALLILYNSLPFPEFEWQYLYQPTGLLRLIY